MKYTIGKMDEDEKGMKWCVRNSKGAIVERAKTKREAYKFRETHKELDSLALELKGETPSPKNPSQHRLVKVEKGPYDDFKAATAVFHGFFGGTDLWAVVEDDNGKVHTVDPERITFVPPTKGAL